MGQKVNPIGFRVGIVRDWESTWYADKDCKFLHEDLKIRKFLKAKLFHAGISKVRIERAASRPRSSSTLQSPASSSASGQWPRAPQG